MSLRRRVHYRRFHCISIMKLLYVVKKGHEQVEKTLEMEKRSRNGKVIKQGTVGMCMMFSQCNTCSMVIYQAYVYDTISRGVWPHRGPCLLRFFSRLPEALCGLMTKQTPFMQNTVRLIKHSLNYIKTSNNRLSEKPTTSVLRTNHLSPQLTNVAPYQTFREADTSLYNYTPVIGH